MLTPTTTFVIGLSRLGLIMRVISSSVPTQKYMVECYMADYLLRYLVVIINNQKEDTGKIGNRFYHGKSVIYAKTPCHGYRPPSAFAAALLARV